MTEVAESFLKVLEECSILLETNLLTYEEIDNIQSIIKVVHEHSEKFNAIVTSKNKLTKDELFQLHIHLEIIIKSLKKLHNLFPKISKRYFAIIEEAKEA